MKTCSQCRESKPLDEFYRNSAKKDGRQSRCKACQKAHHAAHYRANREKYVEMSRKWARGRRREFLEWLATQNCADCGISDIRVLQCDHTEDNKVANVAALIQGSREKLWAEVAKCDVVCANCHTIRTATRSGWYSEYWDKPFVSSGEGS